MNQPTGHAALKIARDILGSETAIAAAIGKRQQSVNGVFRRGKPAPAEWCIPLEEATGGKITRHQLRPDLYPEPTQ